MVDVGRPMAGLTPAHAAGLRRLSARASSTAATSASHRNGLLPLAPLAESLISRLRSAGVPIAPGLSDAELARVEANLGLAFPPDLRAVLSLGLPAGPGFPNWRSRSCSPALDLPSSAVAVQVARGAFWARSWGPRPADPYRALTLARAALRRAPPLVPLFDRCYIPSRPSIAGNPIFLVDEDQITCCGADLADFFRREASPVPLRRQMSAGKPPLMPTPSSRRSLDSIAGRAPRWIEFWSDAAVDRRRRSTHASGPSDPERFVEIRVPRLPGWVAGFLDRIVVMLMAGGWEESEVRAMVGESATAGVGVAGGQAVVDVLVVKADRWSDSLRRAGWSSEEVADMLSFKSRREMDLQHHRRRPPVELSPEIAAKIGRLAEKVSHS